MLLSTFTITVVAEFVDLVKKWIAAWYQTSKKLLTDLNFDQLCEKSQFKEKLNTVYDLRIEPGHIFLDGLDMGPDFCIKAHKFREVLVMSTQAGDFLILRGKMFSVTGNDFVR